MELFSGIKMNSLENLAMNSTINCTIQKARRTSAKIVLLFVLFCSDRRAGTLLPNI